MAKIRISAKPISAAEDVPIRPRPVTGPGISGTLPFNAGTWKAQRKDELPTAIQQEIEEAVKTPPAKVGNAIPRPKVISIDDLPAEKQKELLNVIKSAGSAPVHERVARTQPQPKPTIRVTPPPQRVEEKVRPTPAPTSSSAELEVDTPEPAPEVKPTTAGSMQGERTLFCKHCSYPVDNDDYCNPTALDKKIYVAAIKGSKRFMKEYALLDGSVLVTFRGMTPAENDLIITQVGHDWTNNKFTGPSHAYAETLKYQLVLSIDNIVLDAGRIEVPALNDYEFDEQSGATKLPLIVDYVFDNILTTESLRRIITHAFNSYLDTVKKLEDNAETPDFYQAIATSA